MPIKPKEQFVIALGDLDFSWCQSTINEVIEMWKQGAPLWEISKIVRPANRYRDTDDSQMETFVLLMHLIREGKIKERGEQGVC